MTEAQGVELLELLGWLQECAWLILFCQGWFIGVGIFKTSRDGSKNNLFWG